MNWLDKILISYSSLGFLNTLPLRVHTGILVEGCPQVGIRWPLERSAKMEVVYSTHIRRLDRPKANLEIILSIDVDPGTSRIAFFDGYLPVSELFGMHFPFRNQPSLSVWRAFCCLHTGPQNRRTVGVN